MSEKTTEQLRDEATAYAIDAAEYQREAERLREIGDDARSKLVETTAQLDETRRELAQVQVSERAVRRLVIRAKLDGRSHLSVDEVRAELDGVGP